LRYTPLLVHLRLDLLLLDGGCHGGVVGAELCIQRLHVLPLAPHAADAGAPAHHLAAQGLNTLTQLGTRHLLRLELQAEQRSKRRLSTVNAYRWPEVCAAETGKHNARLGLLLN
jgi:hypothetical protein